MYKTLGIAGFVPVWRYKSWSGAERFV